MKLLFIRHAQSTNNLNCVMADGELRREPDPSLTDLGRRQAEALGRYASRLPRPTRLFSSLMLRALHTAEPLARAWDLPIEARVDLFERFGPYSGPGTRAVVHPGSPRSVLQASSERVVLPDACTETGWRFAARTETHAEAVLRAGALARWLGGFGTDEVIAVVSHGAIGSLLFSALLASQQADRLADQERGGQAVWFELANTSTSLLELAHGRVTMRWMNRVDHLADGDVEVTTAGILVG